MASEVALSQWAKARDNRAVNPRLAAPPIRRVFVREPERGRTKVVPSPAARQAPARSLLRRSGPRNVHRSADHQTTSAAARSSLACRLRYAEVSPTDIP